MIESQTVMLPPGWVEYGEYHRFKTFYFSSLRVRKRTKWNSFGRSVPFPPHSKTAEKNPPYLHISIPCGWDRVQLQEHVSLELALLLLLLLELLSWTVMFRMGARGMTGRGGREPPAAALTWTEEHFHSRVSCHSRDSSTHFLLLDYGRYVPRILTVFPSRFHSEEWLSVTVSGSQPTSSCASLLLRERSSSRQTDRSGGRGDWRWQWRWREREGLLYPQWDCVCVCVRGG